MHKFNLRQHLFPEFNVISVNSYFKKKNSCHSSYVFYSNKLIN